jgi:hypothetical protein
MGRRQQQSVKDRLIPRDVWEANKARHRTWRDHGVDSDVLTVGDENEESGQGNDPKNEETLKETIEAVFQRTTTAMIRRVLLFSDRAATSLYDDQMIANFDVL